jgi:hypothetical protein
MILGNVRTVKLLLKKSNIPECADHGEVHFCPQGLIDANEK